MMEMFCDYIMIAIFVALVVIAVVSVIVLFYTIVIPAAGILYAIDYYSKGSEE